VVAFKVGASARSGRRNDSCIKAVAVVVPHLRCVISIVILHVAI
jgi:hypothetical protein